MLAEAYPCEYLVRYMYACEKRATYKHIEHCSIDRNVSRCLDTLKGMTRFQGRQPCQNCFVSLLKKGQFFLF